MIGSDVREQVSNWILSWYDRKCLWMLLSTMIWSSLYIQASLELGFGQSPCLRSEWMIARSRRAISGQDVMMLSSGETSKFFNAGEITRNTIRPRGCISHFYK